jgi:hypothetical protein
MDEETNDEEGLEEEESPSSKRLQTILWFWMMKRLRLPLVFVLYMELSELRHSSKTMRMEARMVVTLEREGQLKILGGWIWGWI